MGCTDSRLEKIVITQEEEDEKKLFFAKYEEYTVRKNKMEKELYLFGRETRTLYSVRKKMHMGIEAEYRHYVNYFDKICEYFNHIDYGTHPFRNDPSWYHTHREDARILIEEIDKIIKYIDSYREIETDFIKKKRRQFSLGGRYMIRRNIGGVVYKEKWKFENK